MSVHPSGQPWIPPALYVIASLLLLLPIQDELSICPLKISLRTLRQLEQDNGNPTLETVNSVLRAFGMTLGIVPLRRR